MLNVDFFILCHLHRVLVRLVPSVNKQKLLISRLALHKTLEHFIDVLFDPGVDLLHQAQIATLLLQEHVLCQERRLEKEEHLVFPVHL